MYDDLIKNRLENPAHYDRMIALLISYDNGFKTKDETCTLINTCIRGALEHGDYSTGCVFALRTSIGKVRLFLEPLKPLTKS